MSNFAADLKTASRIFARRFRPAPAINLLRARTRARRAAYTRVHADWTENGETLVERRRGEKSAGAIGAHVCRGGAGKLSRSRISCVHVFREGPNCRLANCVFTVYVEVTKCAFRFAFPALEPGNGETFQIFNVSILHVHQDIESNKPNICALLPKYENICATFE